MNKTEFKSLDELKEFLTENREFSYPVYHFQKMLCDITLIDKDTIKGILVNNLPFLNDDFDKKGLKNGFFITSLEMQYIIANWDFLLEEQREIEKIQNQKINYLLSHGKKFKRKKFLPKYCIIDYFEVKNAHNMFFKSRNEKIPEKYYTGWELTETNYNNFIKQFNTNKL